MSFLGTLLTLLWDQFSPVFRPTQFDRLYVRYAEWVQQYFNAGTSAHGFLAWAVAALLPALLVGVLGSILGHVAYLLGLAWSVAVLYQCMGLGQIAEQAVSLRRLLLSGDLPRTRVQLVEMGLMDAVSIADERLPRRAAGYVLELGLERVFGVLFWYVLLGPFGAVAYALTVPLIGLWRGDSEFHVAVGHVRWLVDWLPARLLAVSFALAGNFEEALLKWRMSVSEGEADNRAAVSEAGLGALGMVEEDTDPVYVSGAAALLKRVALLWTGVLGLVWLGMMAV